MDSTMQNSILGGVTLNPNLQQQMNTAGLYQMGQGNLGTNLTETAGQSASIEVIGYFSKLDDCVRNGLPNGLAKNELTRYFDERPEFQDGDPIPALDKDGQPETDKDGVQKIIILDKAKTNEKLYRSMMKESFKKHYTSNYKVVKDGAKVLYYIVRLIGIGQNHSFNSIASARDDENNTILVVNKDQFLELYLVGQGKVNEIKITYNKTDIGTVRPLQDEEYQKKHPGKPEVWRIKYHDNQKTSHSYLIDLFSNIPHDGLTKYHDTHIQRKFITPESIQYIESVHGNPEKMFTRLKLKKKDISGDKAEANRLFKEEKNRQIKSYDEIKKSVANLLNATTYQQVVNTLLQTNGGGSSKSNKTKALKEISDSERHIREFLNKRNRSESL